MFLLKLNNGLNRSGVCFCATDALLLTDVVMYTVQGDALDTATALRLLTAAAASLHDVLISDRVDRNYLVCMEAHQLTY